MRRLSLLICALLLALLPSPSYASGDPEITPIAASNSAGTLDVYEITLQSGTSAYVKSWTGGSWTGWSQVSTQTPPFLIQGNTAVIYPGDNYRWAILSDEGLYCQSNPSSSWIPMTAAFWTTFRQEATPAILREPGSVARIVAIDNQDRVLSGTFQIGSGCLSSKLSAFSNTGGLTHWSPTIAGTSDTDYLISVIGTNNHVYWSYNNGAWTETTPVGQSSGSPALTTWGGGRYDLFVRGLGADDSLYHNPNNTFWENLGGHIVRGPGCVSWALNRIDCFAIGLNSDVYHIDWNGSWSAWEDLGSA